MSGFTWFLNARGRIATGCALAMTRLFRESHIFYSPLTISPLYFPLQRLQGEFDAAGVFVDLFEAGAGFFNLAALVLSGQLAAFVEHLLQSALQIAHAGVHAKAGLEHGLYPLAERVLRGVEQVGLGFPHAVEHRAQPRLKQDLLDAGLLKVQGREVHEMRVRSERKARSGGL